MNWDRIEGNWKQLKGEAKRRWSLLNDDELTQVSGRRDLLIGRIQAKYGIAQDEARRQIDEWAGNVRSSVDSLYSRVMRSAREQPIATLGGVMLAGFVLGALWKR